MKNFIGTSGWSYDHWRGLFYPGDLGKAGWLEFYAEKFDSVELNATFYRLPKEETVRMWRGRTPKDFVFAVKLSRYVTHVKRLLDAGDSLSLFVDRVRHLKEKCGPILIQLPPNLKFNRVRFRDFAAILVGEYKTHRFTLECRNETWFNSGVYDLLRDYGISLCISDTPHYPYSEEVTSSFIYARLHGHEQLYTSNYGREQLGEWAEKIRGWNSDDLDVYIYFDNDANAYAPHNALMLREFLDI